MRIFRRGEAMGACLEVAPYVRLAPCVRTRGSVRLSRMSQDESLPMIVEASEAARQLGVSPSGMRRLLVIYEQVHGELPRKGPKETDARILSSEVVERLGAARGLVEQERFRSIAEALTALDAGLKPDLTVESTLDTPAKGLSGEALGLLLDELRAVRERLAGVEEELSAVREELTTLKALPPAAVDESTPDEVRAIRERLAGVEGELSAVRKEVSTPPGVLDESTAE